MVGFKECFKCKTIKPFEDFYKHSKMADGHLNKCKECAKTDVSNNRLKNIDRIRQYDRDRSKNKKRILASTAYTKSWRAQDSRRQVAHSAVARAIRSGTLVRQPCVLCGSEKTVAHHEDYDRPLQVTWLCVPCHVLHHNRNRHISEGI